MEHNQENVIKVLTILKDNEELRAEAHREAKEYAAEYAASCSALAFEIAINIIKDPYFFNIYAERYELK